MDDGGPGAGGSPLAGAQAWRAATRADRPVFMAVQAVAHPLLQERWDVFANKLDLYPEGCRILVAGSVPVAYGIAHPWLLGQVPPLDALLPGLPDRPDSLYIHDVALLPAARRKGAAQAYVGLMADIALRSGWGALALVSVYDTYPIWQRCGFEVVPLPGLETKFGPFGATARYMTAAIGGRPAG